MQTFSTKAQLRAALLKHHRKHDHVVLVPTMGALHAGHRALLEQARKLAGEDGVVVASIFVNPIQFNNSSDLQTYPRTPEKDLEVCEGAGVDYVFSPTPEEMYSGERSIAVEESFCPQHCAVRPARGIFRCLHGACQTVQPGTAHGRYFRQEGLPAACHYPPHGARPGFPVRIHGAEIVRHGNGLAYSSRNARLTPEQKEQAVVIRQAMLQARDEFQAGADASKVKEHAAAMIEGVPGTRIDYLEIVDAETMQPLAENRKPALMAAAVYFGDVRLIDNIEL